MKKKIAVMMCLVVILSLSACSGSDPAPSSPAEAPKQEAPAAPAPAPEQEPAPEPQSAPEPESVPDPQLEEPPQQTAQGTLMGSAESNKYHKPKCASAKKISPENIIWFQDIADAEGKGYVSCGKCF